MLGGKAEASVIGSASDSCVVEAVFKVENDDVAKEIVEENGLDWFEYHFSLGGKVSSRVVLASDGRRCILYRV